MHERKKTTEKDFVKNDDEPSFGGLHFTPSRLAAPDCRGAGLSLTVNEEDITLLVEAGLLRHQQPSQEG